MTGLSRPIRAAGPHDPGRRPTHLPAVSIVMPTVDRPQVLTRCVKSLLSIGYPDLEVLVVDNRSDPAKTRRWQQLMATDARISYLTEPRPGVSNARNTGLAVARGDYVGFVDEDIEVDPWRLHNLAAELAADEIDCVTSSGCALWRRSTLERLGGFDPLLGPGTPSRAGEDLYLLLRLTRDGKSVIYAPDAMAWRDHGVEWPELRARIRGYGIGLSAMLPLHVPRRPADLVLLARALPGRIRLVVLARSVCPDRRTRAALAPLARAR